MLKVMKNILANHVPISIAVVMVLVVATSVRIHFFENVPSLILGSVQLIGAVLGALLYKQSKKNSAVVIGLFIAASILISAMIEPMVKHSGLYILGGVFAAFIVMLAFEVKRLYQKVE